MSEFKPFENKEETERITKERDLLIEKLQKYDIPDTERMFIMRKISNITERLLKAARYGK